MTRINLIPVEELTREHLQGEYKEITRVFGLVRKAQEKGKNKWNIKQPESYTMGTGHVLYFYTRLSWILDRYQKLIDELRRRGYNPNPIAVDDLTSGIHSHWFGCYDPTEKDIAISRGRINERLAK